MAYRPHSRASVDPEYPRAFATCDRCGKIYNLEKLSWQWQWRGSSLQNTRVLACVDCIDNPSQFLRAIFVPADPPAIFNVRPEPYAIDAANVWDLVAPLGAPGSLSFRVISGLTVVLS